MIQQGLSETPDNVRLRSSQAVVAYKLGSREGALTQFRDLYGPAAAHHNLAVLDIEHGKLDAAKDQLKQATQSPDSLSESIELSNALNATLARHRRDMQHQ